MLTLTIISWIFLGLGLLSAIIIYVDINMGRYQKMPIMNLAWVITAAYSSVMALYMYFKYGRAKPQAMDHGGHGKHTHKAGTMNGCPGMHEKSKKKKPAKKEIHWYDVYISSTHCGAGCGLADIISETVIYWAAITIFGAAIFASFFIDYGVALVFGFAFQYFNIKPMRPDWSRWKTLKNAAAADIWSLTSFQIGMYAWLLAVYFIFDGQLNAASPIFWFMMQIGLTIGLLTTYPVNYMLIKLGVKTPCSDM